MALDIAFAILYSIPKLLFLEIRNSQSELTQVRANFQKVSGLIHQRIAAYRMFLEAGDTKALVMEFVEGVTLAEYGVLCSTGRI